MVTGSYAHNGAVRWEVVLLAGWSHRGQLVADTTVRCPTDNWSQKPGFHRAHRWFQLPDFVSDVLQPSAPHLDMSFAEQAEVSCRKRRRPGRLHQGDDDIGFASQRESLR